MSAAAASAAAASAVPSLSSLQLTATSNSNASNNNKTPQGDATTTTTTADTSLSEDLALFLSNPSLRAALADGSLDLASYSSIVEEELQELESSCIRLYREKTTEIQELRLHVTECQTVLRSLHEMLLGFQADLGGLSGDIRQLQEKSRSLDVQIKNRRLADAGISAFLSHTVISPSVAHAIMKGPVNMVFLRAVQELQVLYQNCCCSTNTTTPPQSWWAAGKPPLECMAGRELQTKLVALRSKAVVQIRTYFLQQIALLRRQPQTNIRMIQVHGLLKYAALQDFLMEGRASPEIGQEIVNVYLESMSKILLQLFRTYQGQLLQLDATRQAATRQDVIAIDDAVLRDSLTTRAKKRVDLFCLGARATECLLVEPTLSSAAAPPQQQPSSSTTSSSNTSTTRGMEQQQQQQQAAATAFAVHNNISSHSSTAPNVRPRPILAHVALAENQRFPYERLFRSLLGHLVDAVTNEHVFCRQFFKRDCFQPLFGQHGMTLSLILEQLENYLFGCYDALCLLLMIKVTHAFRRITRNRQIHSLDPFFDQVTHLLWPRLKMIMEHHHRSIKQATAIKLGCTSSDNLQQHYVSRRFAEFCCSILLILHNNNTTTVASSSNASSNNSNNNSASTPSSALKRRASSAVTPTLPSSSDKKTSPSQNTLSSPFAQQQQKPSAIDSTTRRKSTSDLDLTDSAVSSSDSNDSPHQYQQPQYQQQQQQHARLDRSTHSTGVLHKSAGDQLLQDLSVMLEDFVSLLERLAEEHDYSSQKLKTVFLINNLDHVVCIFQERRVIVGKEFNRFVELLMKQRELFVEEELLATGFSKMIAFVQQTEAHMATLSSSSASSSSAAPSSSRRTTLDIVNVSVVESLILDFASNWKNNVEQINRNVLSYFSNFRNGVEILKQCLTQLLLYYTRFQDIIRKVWRNQKPPAFTKDLVSTTQILAEIKKYALAI